MTLRWRRAAITVLCVSCAGEVYGQRPVPTLDDVRAGLHSPIGADVAWAAFNAGTFQMREAVPDLIAVLASPPVTDAQTRDYMVAAVLDALIQLRNSNFAEPKLAAPSASTLDRYYERWPIQVLVLMSLMSETAPERGDVLERWFHTARGLQWYAVANLLLNQKPSPPGFANDLLDGIKLRLQIDVTDGGTGIASGSAAGGGVEDGVGQHPRGFPPHAVYRFERGPYAGAIVLAHGPRTSYYSRRIVNDRQFFIATLLMGGPSITDRLDYLNTLLNGPSALNRPLILRESTTVDIAWKNARDLRDRVQTERQRIAEAWQRTITALIAAGYLSTVEAAALPLPLTVDVYDRRRRPHGPLPEIAVKEP